MATKRTPKAPTRKAVSVGRTPANDTEATTEELLRQVSDRLMRDAKDARGRDIARVAVALYFIATGAEVPPGAVAWTRKVLEVWPSFREEIETVADGLAARLENGVTEIGPRGRRAVGPSELTDEQIAMGLRVSLGVGELGKMLFPGGMKIDPTAVRAIVRAERAKGGRSARVVAEAMIRRVARFAGVPPARVRHFFPA